MDDDDLAELQRLADIAAGHLRRYRELIEAWLADPVRDPRKLRQADDEKGLLDQALADVDVFLEPIRRRRLS